MHTAQSELMPGEYFPIWHVMHDEEPSGYAYFGAVHTAQSLWPAAFVYLPISQLVQVDILEVGAYVPTPQE